MNSVDLDREQIEAKVNAAINSCAGVRVACMNRDDEQMKLLSYRLTVDADRIVEAVVSYLERTESAKPETPED